jgi:hypothetical protein
MRLTPGNIGTNRFPPNPTQWESERNGYSLRARFGRALDLPLNPFEIATRFDGVVILTPSRFSEIVGETCAQELFGRSREMWSGFVVPINGQHLIVINHTHALTRQNATLTEELFHIALGHKPMKICTCPRTGMLRREYSKEIESEAYCAAAAALLPYSSLCRLLGSGETISAIADSFGASVSLVEFRLKVTRLWKRRA